MQEEEASGSERSTSTPKTIGAHRLAILEQRDSVFFADNKILLAYSQQYRSTNIWGDQDIGVVVGIPVLRLEPVIARRLVARRSIVSVFGDARLNAPFKPAWDRYTPSIMAADFTLYETGEPELRNVVVLLRNQSSFVLQDVLNRGRALLEV